MDNPKVKEKKTYIAIGYWYDKTEKNLPDPAWFVTENYSEVEKKKVLEYLGSATDLIFYRGISWCRFNCGKVVPGSSDKTDGEFIFPSGLIHYVEEHNVQLPKEFLDKILKEKTVQIESLKGGNPRYVENHLTYFVNYNWWLKQKGIDNTRSSKKTKVDENAPDVYIYKDGTKKIESNDKIEMIFPDGRKEMILK